MSIVYTNKQYACAVFVCMQCLFCIVSRSLSTSTTTRGGSLVSDLGIRKIAGFSRVLNCRNKKVPDIIGPCAPAGSKPVYIKITVYKETSDDSSK